MDYSITIGGLFRQAKKRLQYNRLPTAHKVLMFIGLLPLVIISVPLLITFFVIDFVSKIISAPSDFLNKFLHEERDGVKHLTQAVMYSIGFPMVFLLKISLSFLAMYMCIAWFLLMCLFYVITLGGVKWQPYLFSAKFDEIEDTEFKPSIFTAKMWAIIQFSISLAFFWVGFALLLEGLCGYYYSYYTCLPVGIAFTSVYMLTTCITIPVMFRKAQCQSNPKPQTIKEQQYSKNLNIREITISANVTEIGAFAFYNCTNLTKIKYKGTTTEWMAIKKGDHWNYGVPAKFVTCTDGDVTL